MFLNVFFIKVKKHAFYVFFNLQINVFNFYGTNEPTNQQTHVIMPMEKVISKSLIVAYSSYVV